MIIGDETVAAVLAPIDGDGENGVGVDGRADEGPLGETFRELRFQRKAIFRAEQRIAMNQEPDDDNAWDWATLGEAAAAYLAESSKDLEVLAMLLEAAVRVDGLPGLQRGTALIADAVAAFWDQGLYPPEDEDDGIEARFLPLSALSGGSGDKDGPLVMPIRRLALAGNTAGDALRHLDRFTATAKFQAAQNAKPDDRDALKREAEAALAEIDATARRLGTRAVATALAGIEASEANWRRAVGFIFERTRPRAPAASRVADELKAIGEWLKGLVAKLPPDTSAPAVEAEAADADEAAAGGVPAVANGVAAPVVFSIGRITRRDDALKAVTAAADYFDEFEPLSPLGATLREVDRRARMSLETLLEELIPDAATRQTYYWRLGIKPKDAG